MKRSNKKGFTIVELVIVIAVIAILAAVLIPTFINLTKKANESVDMQLVRHMNTALQTDEALNGIPATVVDAKAVLAANGITQFSPVGSGCVFYWVGSDNRVLLWEKNSEDETKGKILYPEDLAEKYEDKTNISSDWHDLSVEYTEENYKEVTASEGQTLLEALIAAVKAAKDGDILRLPENSVLDMSNNGLYLLGEALKIESSGIGKHITIDLNNSFITSSGANLSNMLCVPANGSLTLANGSVNIEHGKSASYTSFGAKSGSSLILRDIDMTTSTAAVYPSKDASEVIISNSTINAYGYAVATNRLESSNIRISIDNSTLASTSCSAILVNTPSYTKIANSSITGVVHALIVRAGVVEVKDSILVTTDTEPGIYSYNNFAVTSKNDYGFQGYWKSGNTLPAGVIVAGDYAQADKNGVYAYSGDVTVTLTNVKLQSADSNTIPEILMASSDPSKNIKVNYDDTSSVGRVILYGTDWNGTGSNASVTIANKGNITVNGKVATLEGGKTKIGD